MADSSNNKGYWVEENILHPAASSLKEAANAGINLVNVALPKSAEIPKFEVKHDEEPTVVGMLVSGAVSVVPYALAGGLLGRALRCVPAGESAWLLQSKQLAQLGGAAIYDGVRDVRPGETKFGNILGSVAGFGTFEAGNYAIKGMTFGSNRVVQLAAQLPLRLGVGAAGGALGSVFSDLGSFKAPELTKVPEAAITSAAMNTLLPAAQSLIFRGLGLHPSLAPPARIDSHTRTESSAGTPAAQLSNVVQVDPPQEGSMPESAIPDKTPGERAGTRGSSAGRSAYSQDREPTPLDFNLGNQGKVMIGRERFGSRSPWTFTPEFIHVDPKSGVRFWIDPLGSSGDVPGWVLTFDYGPRQFRYGEIEAHEGGRALSIFGRKISLKSATAEDIANAFVFKPSIDPVIKPQIAEFEKLAAPLDELQFDLESSDIRNTRQLTATVNGIREQMHTFLSTHQSAGFKDALLDWADRNPNQMVRSYVIDYYATHPTAWTRYFNEMVREESKSYFFKTTDRAYRDIINAPSRLRKMLDRGVTADQLEETQANLLRLLDDGRDPQSISRVSAVTRSEDYKRAVFQAFMHAADPDSISQWNHPTCALAGVEHLLYKKHPEIATGMLRQVFENGTYVTVDGTTIKLEPFSMAPTDTALRYDRSYKEPYRTYASQILQTLLGNIYWQRATVNPGGIAVPKGSLRYELIADANGQRERVVDHANNQVWERGFTPQEVADIQEQIAPHVRSKRVPADALESPSALQTWLSAVPTKEFPVRIGVDARHLGDKFSEGDIQYHAMNINRIVDPHKRGGWNKSMAEVKNPHTSGVQFISVADLWKMAYERPNYAENPLAEPF